jgi:hemerythrin-like metal-binding protein
LDHYKWKREYSVGIAILDQQHQHLFELVNELHEFMTAGQSEAVLTTTLTELVACTRRHFLAEEALMAQFNFPCLDAHRIEHEKINRAVLKFIRDYEAGEKRFTMQLLDFMIDWLTSHILTTDMLYSQFLLAQGAA